MVYRHGYLPRDVGTRLFDAKASGWWVVASYDSTYYVDLGTVNAQDADQKDPGYVAVKITALAGTGATVALSLRDCDTSGGTYAVLTPVQVLVPATAFDDALWGEVLYLPVPDWGVRQFLKITATIGTANLTAGVIDAWYAKRAQ